MSPINRTRWPDTRRTEKLVESYTEAHFRQRNPYIVPTPEKLRIDQILYVIHVLLNELREEGNPRVADREDEEEVG